MVGTVVIIVVLAVVFPVIVMMSGAPAAAIIGYFLKTDRDEAYKGTEYLTLANGSATEEDEDADA